MVDPVGSQASLDRLLALSLVPSPFPFRRDVALDGRTTGPGRSFVDHFWTAPAGLAVVAAHLPGETLVDVAGATLLRELLRAACRLHTDAGRALDEGLGAYGAVLPAPPPVDCAILRLDLSTRAFDVALRGEAAAGPARGRARPSLSPGQLLFLRAGLPGLRLPAAGSQDGPGEIAAAALAARRSSSPDGGALVVLLGGALKGPPDELTLSLANSAAEVEGAQRAMEAFLNERTVPAETQMALTLVFDELFTNIVSYAFPDGRRHEVIVRLAVTAHEVALELRDDGVPFDPLRVPAETQAQVHGGEDLEEESVGGLGLSFARRLGDRLDYERAGGWNVLRWRKGLSAQD